MALNHGLMLRSTSTPSPEGSPRRGIHKSRLQDESLTKDKSFQRYTANVERALGLFDSTLQEWADYISFLGRLLRALTSHPDGVNIIPNKLIVAKRLAQCLNPALPSGVHKKALEVYAFIFAFIQEDGLERDLAIYLPGIASTLTFASVSVRPLFLTLMENYVLKVPVHTLRPASKALILSLLPGLEEETSDDFEKTLSTLNQCKKAFTSAAVSEVFWQNLFLASITSPSRRPGVLIYLNRYLPKLSEAAPNTPIEKDVPGNADVAAITTPEPGLLLRCFATGLADQQVLVQRAFLDLLVTHMPLHASIFSQMVGADDVQLLVSAAVGVVLRRDMSLNRRLWSWFLGHELGKKIRIEGTPSLTYSSNEMDNGNNARPPDMPSYFQTYGVQHLIRCLETMIVNDSQAPSEVSRPFRISLSLMDQQDIGGCVVDVIFLPLMRSLLAYQQTAMCTEDFEEAFRSANVFFDGVESDLIWSRMFSLVVFGGKTKNEIIQDLNLAIFVITNFKVREEEMLMLHIPLVSLAMLESLSQAGYPPSGHVAPAGDSEVLKNAFRLLILMIDMIPNRAFALRDRALSNSEIFVAEDGIKLNGLQTRVRDFLNQNRGARETGQSPFPQPTICRHFLRLLTFMISAEIESSGDGYALPHQVQVLSLLLKKLPSFDGLDGSILVLALQRRLTVKVSAEEHLPFALVSSAAALVLNTTVDVSHGQIIRAPDIAAIVPVLVRCLWLYLSFSTPQHHLETVHLLQRLHHHFWQEELVTSTILSLLVDSGAESNQPYQPRIEALERYATLWTHSRYDRRISTTSVAGAAVSEMPTIDRTVDSVAAFSSMLSHSMISVLSVLREPQTEVYGWCRDWLQNITDLSSIFEAVMTMIRKSLSMENNSSAYMCNPEADSDLVETLDRLVVAQSKEQWLRFSRQPGAKSYSRPSSQADDSLNVSLQIRVARLCHEIFQRNELRGEEQTCWRTIRLQRVTLNLLRRLFDNPGSEQLLELQFDQLIIGQLGRPVVLQSRLLQTDLLNTLSLVLNLKITTRRSHEATPEHSSNENAPEAHAQTRQATPATGSHKPSRPKQGPIVFLEPPPELLACLLNGITNPSSQDVIQKWIQILCESMYLYSSSMSSMLLKTVECLCKQVETCFSGMRGQYMKQLSGDRSFEHPLLHLLNGIDFVLARAHERLLSEEEGFAAVTGPEQQQGFFGNMVSGTLLTEARQGRKTTNNNRLTVILCFQDALLACFELWSWHSLDSADSSDTLTSFQHASQKIRGRARRILEHLLAAEPQEGVEALVRIWVRAIAENDTKKSACLLDLVHTLEASRPSTTMAAVFNAIYCRTQPSSQALSQKSTLSSNLQESELVSFMCVYAQSLEDDALDEIWQGCMNFLHDVLGNPMPHRQILTRLISFIAILSTKLENTNFGEERKMRRELADLFSRLLTAIFTIKPDSSSWGKTPATSTQSGLGTETIPDNVDETLDRNFAALSALLGETDSLVTVMVNVVTNVVTPLLRSRQFPHNMTSTSLSLFLQITRIQSAPKAWKRELMDTFNDAKFFSSATSMVKHGWLPLLCQLALAERTLLPDILSRLGIPTAAGILFGVGATAARLEADKKAQLNLRRASCVVLAAENKVFAAHLGLLQAKLEELLTASSISSPSSMTRAEIYMVIRALALNTSADQMASFWPMVATELRAAFCSIHHEMEDHSPSTYNSYSLLQAAKLLDVLLLTNPEDFQPQEWVFVTDTVDAIYRREGWEPSALVEEVAQSMMNKLDMVKADNTQLSAANNHPLPGESDHSLRKPWLSGERSRAFDERDIWDCLLRPFFGQLSIHVYERIYSLSVPDLEACKDDLVADLFNARTIVSST